jgi:periplasmic mercuric ion binding protein
MDKLRMIVTSAALGVAALAVAHSSIPHARADGPAAGTYATASLHVEGMTCPSCKVAVRTALSRLDGVKEAKVDVASKSASVVYDPARVKPQQLVDAVNKLGYQASLAVKGAS